MHPARADDEIGSVGQDQGGEVGVVGFSRLRGDGFGRGGRGRGVRAGVGEEVVVVGWEGGGGGAVEAVGGAAVGDYAGYGCGGEGGGGGGGGSVD